jgi:hypothetical protein
MIWRILKSALTVFNCVVWSMNSKRIFQGSENNWPESLSKPSSLEFAYDLQNQPDRTWTIGSLKTPLKFSALFEVLQARSAAQRLEVWQAIERLVRGLSGHQRTNISLQRSRVLLTANVLQGAVLITPDVVPRVEFLLVDAQLDRAEVGSFLLASALESLRTAGVQEVTAHVHGDDNELITLLQAFGFAA